MNKWVDVSLSRPKCAAMQAAQRISGGLTFDLSDFLPLLPISTCFLHSQLRRCDQSKMAALALPDAFRNANCSLSLWWFGRRKNFGAKANSLHVLLLDGIGRPTSKNWTALSEAKKRLDCF